MNVLPATLALLLVGQAPAKPEAPAAEEPAAPVAAPAPAQAQAPAKPLTNAQKVVARRRARRAANALAQQRAMAGAAQQLQAGQPQPQPPAVGVIAVPPSLPQSLLNLEAARVQAEQVNAAANAQRAQIANQRFLWDAYRSGAPVMYTPNGAYVLPFGGYPILP